MFMFSLSARFNGGFETMTEEQLHQVALKRRVAVRVNNEKHLGESWSDCIERIFDEVEKLRREFVR